MSMLSSQVDELREAADEASSLDYTEFVNIGWMRNTLAPMLRGAADTIISLRDRLQASELGSGTCRIAASSTDGLCSDHPRQRFELSCGHSFTIDGLGAPVACPVCGRKVDS